MGYLLYLGYNQLGCFAAGHHAHMVHVEVEEIELRFLVSGSSVKKSTAATVVWPHHAELTPGADADASGIPTQARFFWGLAQPEIPMIQKFYLPPFIKDGLMFTAALAVVATDAYIVIAIEGFFHVLKLSIKHLLCPKDIRCHKVHLVADHLATFGPNIALKAVVGVFIADVVGAHKELLGGHLQGDCKQQGDKKMFFHLMVFCYRKNKQNTISTQLISLIMRGNHQNEKHKGYEHRT